MPQERKLLYCSFCGKSQHEVFKLIAGPGVFICEKCTDLCVAIVLEEGAELKNMPTLESLIQKGQDKNS